MLKQTQISNSGNLAQRPCSWYHCSSMGFLNKNSCYLDSNISPISLDPTPSTTHTFLAEKTETQRGWDCHSKLMLHGSQKPVSCELTYSLPLSFIHDTLSGDISSEEPWQYGDALCRSSFQEKCVVQLQGVCVVENLQLLSAFKIYLNFWAEAILFLSRAQPKTQMVRTLGSFCPMV